MAKVTTVVLTQGKDFTTTGLKDFLNNKYGSKKTGKSFTIGDLQQYALAGRFPEQYGGHPISTFENKEIGIKILTVDFTKSAFKED